jgi:hypothetical protein
VVLLGINKIVFVRCIMEDSLQTIKDSSKTFGLDFKCRRPGNLDLSFRPAILFLTHTGRVTET